MADRAGLSLHMHGQDDGTDPALRAELDRLFETVVYFDQHPDEFVPSVRKAALVGQPVTAPRP